MCSVTPTLHFQGQAGQPRRIFQEQKISECHCYGMINLRELVASKKCVKASLPAACWVMVLLTEPPRLFSSSCQGWDGNGAVQRGNVVLSLSFVCG